MKIAVFEVEDWEREAFEELERDHEVRFFRQPLTPKTARRCDDADIVSVFIYSKLTRDVLDHLGRLKLVATRSTGFEHIDTEVCEARGIAVANVPSYGENTVAEHTFGLLLALSHKIVDAVDRTRKGDFSQQGLQGFDLAGKTFGLIGTGAIGRHVARIARGFEMEVLAHDVEPDEPLARELGFDYVDLDTLLERSDVISLHVPLNDQTRNLLDREQFAKMKRGVVVLNTSRGAVINTRELLRALGERKVVAAGLDVLDEEPAIREEAELLHRTIDEEHGLQTLLADHVLLRMRNVLVTPHSGFNTREAVERILHTTVDNISAFIEGASENLVLA